MDTRKIRPVVIMEYIFIYTCMLLHYNCQVSMPNTSGNLKYNMGCITIRNWQHCVDVFEKTAGFLAHLAKGNVSFCHHLASVNFSHFNLLL